MKIFKKNYSMREGYEIKPELNKYEQYMFIHKLQDTVGCLLIVRL